MEAGAEENGQGYGLLVRNPNTLRGPERSRENERIARAERFFRGLRLHQAIRKKPGGARNAAEKTRGSLERYEAIETAPGPPKGAWWSPNRSSRNQSWGVAPIRSRAKMQVDDRTRTRRRRSGRCRRRMG